MFPPELYMAKAQTLDSRLGWILALIIALQSPISPQSPNAPKRVAIRAAKLIDGNADAAISSQTILIEGNRVSAIGANLQIPNDASVIDLGNATILPGIIDSHTHLLSNQNGAIGGYG